ncbi:MAG: EAL domain-containing protein, partial [Lachnospiraceae bacterium]|nr:EAL domain-containing protein [Lachnospiraceae bacterium]
YDITDKKACQEKIEQQAYTDFLTGLYNRICCERDLAWYVEDAKKRGVKGGLLYIDLDDFKHINDGLGHKYGDVLLKEISGALSRINGIRTTCYRVGGDEFVILVPPESYAEFDNIIADIQSVFTQPWNLHNGDYYCTMSMGIVTFPDDGDNVQDIIKKSDIAMYEAKNKGKNRCARYAEGTDSYSGRRLDMEKNMRDAAVAGYGEFEVYYQPIIDISQPALPCTGAEALIRWNSATLGFISPAEFIPLAEYLGLINPIGSHVLQEACRECKKWNDNGYPGYKVNVNLSVVQLLQPDIVETIRQTLVETGVRPHNLTLEVTESLAINDMVRMKEILMNIKALGVRIALDDFGTGYSSLNHIREIPFDVIKVAQRCV